MSVPVKIYRTVTYQEGQTPSNPNLSGDPVVNPINPNGGAAEELVPYDGAIKNVNLGEKGLSTGFVQYDTTPTDTPTGAGTVVWNPDKYTLDLSMGLGDSVQQIGMEVYYTPVKNQTGSLIPDGTFVMATGSLGNSGRMTIAPAVTDGSVDSKYMLGVTTHDIANGGDGLVTWFGEIRGFNTNTKAPVGETWIDGTVLWNNPTVAGGFTSVEPQAPNLKIPVAIVISAGNNGVIFVRPRLGMRLTDLHDVDAFSPSDKDLISYDSALGHWNAKSLGSVIGGTSSQFLKGDGSLDSNSYALASQINISSGQVAFGTGVNTIGGDSGLVWDNTAKNLLINTTSFSANATLSISAGSFSSFIEMSGTNSIINGQNNIRFRIGGNDFMRIVSSGNVAIGNISNPTNTLDVNGTARIRTLSNATGDFVTASATGVLQKRTAAETRTDIGAIGGTGTTNYIPKFTASGTIGNSQIFDNGTNVGIGTSSPSVKLEVAGEVRTTGKISVFANGENLELGTNINSNVFISFQEQRGSVGYNGAETFLEGGTGKALQLRTNSLERLRILSTGEVGIATNAPTNTLDVNGTARIRSLTGTTGYLPLLSSTGVMGQSVAYNAGTGIVINGTFLPSGAVFSVNGVSYFNNWATAGAYDKLSIDFGENRGFGYDPTPNEIFVKGATTVPVKIDTDAPTDSLNVLSTGGIKMANIPSGTIANAVGLDSNNELVKGTAVSQFADNESINSAGFTNVITPTSDTEYSFTFSSFDRSAAVGTTYEFEFGAIIVWQNATDINDFKAIIDITSNLSTLLPLIPTATSFPNHYIFKISVTRTNDGWIQVYDARGGSSQLDSRMRYTINTTTTYTGSVTPKLGLKTPTSAFTTGDYIRFLYMNKRRIK